jgi:4-oxalocrotonate tautomerase
MPVVIINMLEGRTKKMKRDLIKKVTDAVVESLGVSPDSVRVIINEVPRENFAVAGLPIEEYRKRQNGILKQEAKNKVKN